MEKNLGVEGETVVLGRQGNPYQGSGSSNTNLQDDQNQDTPTPTIILSNDLNQDLSNVISDQTTQTGS